MEKNALDFSLLDSLGLFQKLPKKEKCFFWVTFHFVHTEGNITPKFYLFLTSVHKMNYLQHIQLVGGGTSLPIGEKVDYLMCVFAPTQQNLAPQW